MNPLQAVGEHWVVVVGMFLTIGAIVTAFKKYRDDVQAQVMMAMRLFLAGEGSDAIREIVRSEIGLRLLEHERIEKVELSNAIGSVHTSDMSVQTFIARQEERLKHVERMVERATTGAWVLPAPGSKP